MAITEQDLIMARSHSTEEFDQEMRIKNLLRSWHGVPSPDDETYNEKLAWCLENCEGKFRDMKVLEERVWYFKNDHDASMFALKWS